MIPANSCAKTLSPFESGVSFICHQQVWCCVNQPMTKNPQVLLTPGLKPAINPLALPLNVYHPFKSPQLPQFTSFAYLVSFQDQENHSPIPLEKLEALYLSAKFYLVLLHKNYKRRYKYFVMLLLQEFHWDVNNIRDRKSNSLWHFSYFCNRSKIYLSNEAYCYIFFGWLCLC